MKRNIWLLVATLSLSGCEQGRGDIDRSNQTSVERSVDRGEPNRGRVESSAQIRSHFTSIEWAGCTPLEEDQELGMWSSRLCQGSAGYRLEIIEDDLRQDIVIWSTDGSKSEIKLTELVANGAFNALGKTAEWRGTDPDHPRVLIVRLNVARNSEESRPAISRLVVIRLASSACVIAVVEPGPGQNKQARAIADGPSRECVAR